MSPRDIRVGPRLALAFGAVLLLLIVTAGYATLRLAAMRDIVQHVAVDRWERAVVANNLVDAVNAGARAKFLMTGSTDSSLVAEATAHLATARQGINGAYAGLDTLLTLPDETALLARIKEARRVHVAAFDGATAAGKAGQPEEMARLVRTEVVPTLDAYIGVINELIALQKRLIHDGAQAGLLTAAEGRKVAILLTTLALLLGAAGAVVITRSIVRPLDDLRVAADRLALGDIEQTVNAEARDEIGDLSRSFAAMMTGQRALATAARGLAGGDAAVAVDVRSPADTLGLAVQQLRETVRSLTGETTKLVAAAKGGRLSERGDVSGFHGAYADLVRGINDTLDAVVAPMQETTTVLERLAERDLTARVQGQYAGDHATVKNALNSALDALGAAMREVGAASQQVASAGGQIAG
ncbi:MAG TPA: HAMP domain-containing protein, partial [Gemmatimonadaceae bacterium]|nr:HAMP domain-containing protein [Gemmatimonadaceae bacterium]